MEAGGAARDHSEPLAGLDRIIGVCFDFLAERPAAARAFLIEGYAAGP